MEEVAESFGVDWTVDCSAADCAALEEKAARGYNRLGLAAHFLWQQREEKRRIGEECRLKDIVSLRLDGKRFGKRIAWKLAQAVWQRHVDLVCRTKFSE